jgi:hypothetical protein
MSLVLGITNTGVWCSCIQVRNVLKKRLLQAHGCRRFVSICDSSQEHTVEEVKGVLPQSSAQSALVRQRFPSAPG